MCWHIRICLTTYSSLSFILFVFTLCFLNISVYLENAESSTLFARVICYHWLSLAYKNCNRTMLKIWPIIFNDGKFSNFFSSHFGLRKHLKTLLHRRWSVNIFGLACSSSFFFCVYILSLFLHIIAKNCTKFPKSQSDIPIPIVS